MIRSSNLSHKLEKFFWIYLFVNPFLDIFNGIYVSLIKDIQILDINFIHTLGITPTLVLRMLVLLIFAFYIILVNDKKAILTAVPIGIFFILSMASEYIRLGHVSYFVDIQYAARFCFNIAVALVYTRVFANRWVEDGKDLKEEVEKIFAFTIIILGFSIILCAILGIGYSAYADRMGYRGSRGFFYAGNDITAVLATLTPICTARAIDNDFIHNKKGICFFAIAAALGFNSLIIIGSKTAFICAAFAYLAPIGYVFIKILKREAKKYIKPLIITGGFAIGIFLIIVLLSKSNMLGEIRTSFTNPAIIAKMEGLEKAIFSGRTVKLANHLQQFKDGGIITWLFGLGRGSQEFVLEMDLFEVFFYYGLLGGIAFIWLYIKLAFDFLSTFCKKPDMMSISLFAAIGLTAGSMILAGHILFSVTSGFYFMITIVFSRLYLANNKEEILLWETKL